MKVTRLAVRNFRGIESLDTPIGELGAIVSGANGKGKTSTIKALMAALQGRDIGADAIRLGASKAEILVDLDRYTVRRAITEKGSTVTVKTADGDTKGSPVKWLSDLFGASIDPLALYLSKPRERRSLILAALPMRVTREQLVKFAPDLPASTNLDGHALEVIERVRAWYYERRTAANAADRDARGELERANARAAELGVGIPPDSSSLEDAAADVERWKASLAKLEASADEARRSSERTAGSRARASELRTKAADTIATLKPVADGEYEDACKAGDAAGDEVVRLRAELAAAEERRESCNRLVARIEEKLTFNKAANERARNCIEQADQIEALIADTSVEAPSDADFETARAGIRHANERLAGAQRAKVAADARMIADALVVPAASAKAEAERLDGIVQALTHDAPRVLFSGSETIQGLSLEGDEVLLDNVRLDGLCGAEQLKFAVEIARRANAKGKVLIVDGLERLDPEQLAMFVADATRGGWQLLATRVSAGDVVIEAIQPDGAAVESIQARA